MAIFEISEDDFKTFEIFSGINSISLISSLYVVWLISPFLYAISNDINASTLTCVVNAFVEATPISGPAWVYIPASVNLGIEDPTTLHIPKTVAPLFFASSRAANVSAVSPDWDIAKTISVDLIIGFRYLNSDAYSTSTGIRAKSSIIYSPINPACHEVPQATIIIRFAFIIFC